MPLVFERSVIVFTAGPFTYELSLHTEQAPYEVSRQVEMSMSGETTVMPASFTPLQKQLIVALAEPMLRREGVSMNELPSSSDAAKRLGWTMSKFNRKLDNVCDKLDRMGVQGLRGGRRQAGDQPPRPPGRVRGDLAGGHARRPAAAR